MTLRLNGDSSGFTEIKAPNAAGDNSITLPTSNGGANQLLKNGGTAGELQFASDVYIDSSNRLLVGHSSSSGTGEIQSANAGGENISVYRFSANGGSPDMSFNKSRNATIGEHTLLNDGDALGQLAFRGSDGTTYRTGASIQARVQGTPGASNMPSFLGFYTNSGSSTAREVVRITAAGALKLVDCTGIDFSDIQAAGINGASMTSETLDSYEVGSYTPGFLFAQGVNYLSGTFANYVKIGDLVIANGKIKFDTFTSFPNGYDSLFVPFIGSGTGGGDTSTSYWTTVSGANGQTSTTFNFGPLDPPNNTASSAFTNIFNSGPNACSNANFNDIFVSNSTIKEIRFSVVYRTDG